ncbi:hypothetical protein [Streptomyces blattellae]|uniref:hypothetical protein n=1 Tax=Streptomyces blattellae TaxID=2569855 RepID=UPI0012B7BE2C|nr:hypothetical protein [Streptomyces blattellae]
MPSDDGEGDQKGPATGHSAGWVPGLAFLAFVVVFAGLPLLLTATNTLYLTHAEHGSTPVFRKEKRGGQEATEERYLTWDVHKRAESSFRPEGTGRDFGFEGRELRGELSFSVPRDCADRRIRWEIRVDGERAGGGSLRWLHTYTVKTDFAIDRTPDSVGITMYWDGGDAGCPSFSAEWKDARVERGPIG